MRRSMVLLALAVSGCLSAQLRVPTTEHYVQLATLCAMAGEDAGPEFEADVCQASLQACLLAAIVRGEDGSECGKP